MKIGMCKIATNKKHPLNQGISKKYLSMIACSELGFSQCKHIRSIIYPDLSKIMWNEFEVSKTLLGRVITCRSPDATTSGYFDIFHTFLDMYTYYIFFLLIIRSFISMEMWCIKTYAFILSIQYFISYFELNWSWLYDVHTPKTLSNFYSIKKKWLYCTILEILSLLRLPLTHLHLQDNGSLIITYILFTAKWFETS